MRFTIENEYLKVTVDSLGCEIISIIGKKDGTEYLWYGKEEYWASHAPTMFPICGRLLNGKYTYKGKTYEMNLHGFARHCEFIIDEKTASSISMTLQDDETLFAQYPFHFSLTTTHTLEGDTIRTKHTIRNLGDEVMPYAIGGHPGFNVPVGGIGQFSDCYVEFDKVCEPKKLVMTNDNHLMTDDLEPIALEEGKIIRLHHDMFDKDAIFMKDAARGATLKSTVSGKFVHLSYDDMQYVGLWHKPESEAPYVCIEPWTSVPGYDWAVDDLETKRDMFKLAPRSADVKGYAITIGQ